MTAVRSLNAFDAYSAKSRRELGSAPDLGVYSPCVQVTEDFQYQSYFDSTAYEKAILPQFPNQPIVASTQVSSDVAGHAIALHPSSETPVAIQFKSAKGDGSGASATVVLKPGEVLRPTDGPFTGFTWGLPFGWLGGGVATLVVFITPKADVAWDAENREVLFHRVRLIVKAPADVPSVAAGRIDWPVRLPWPNAYSLSTSKPQFGNPTITVLPSRVQLIVRINPVVTAATIRFLLAQFDDFCITSTGTLNNTIAFFDVVVPTLADPAGLAAQTLSFPVIEFNSGPLLGGGDSAVVTPVDMDDGTNLAGIEVDILRYGRL